MTLRCVIWNFMKILPLNDSRLRSARRCATYMFHWLAAPLQFKDSYLTIMALELANYTASRNIPVKELPVTSTGTQLGIITTSFKQVFHIQFQYRWVSTGTKTTGSLGRLMVMPCYGTVLKPNLQVILTSPTSNTCLLNREKNTVIQSLKWGWKGWNKYNDR